MPIFIFWYSKFLDCTKQSFKNDFIYCHQSTNTSTTITVSAAVSPDLDLPLMYGLCVRVLREHFHFGLVYKEAKEVEGGSNQRFGNWDSGRGCTCSSDTFRMLQLFCMSRKGIAAGGSDLGEPFVCLPMYLSKM